MSTAEEHLDSELRENRDDARSMLGMLVNARESAAERLRLVEATLAARQSGNIVKYDLHGRLYTFSVVFASSSGATAESTGALGHMKYVEARRYAGVYEYQQHVSVTLDKLAEAFLQVSTTLERGLADMDTAELQSARTGLLGLTLLLRTLEGQRQTLLQFYDRALERR